MLDDVLLAARAGVLADLTATGAADPQTVSLLETAVIERRWWLEQWPDGAAYVVGLVAQDVQDGLIDDGRRWPLCRACADEDPHPLFVHPELGGPEPRWVCERAGIEVAPVGALG